MNSYAVIEIVLVSGLVSASAFAAALRLLPAAWLKAPMGAWLDRDGRPHALRRIGARWRNHQKSGCANSCCASGDGCAIGRGVTPVQVELSTAPFPRRIPLTLL